MNNSNQINLTKDEAKVLSHNLMSIVQRSFQDHNQWAQGWHQWVNNQIMSMRMVPIEAYQDFDNKTAWIMNFAQSFFPSAQILKKMGEPELFELIEKTTQEFKKATQAMQQAQATMNNSMNNQNFGISPATNNAILNIQKQTANDIFNMQSSTLKNVQGSSDRAHNQFLDYLRS